MRLVIICEGRTEELVLKAFLAPYCSEFQAVRIVQKEGAANLLNEFRQDAEDFLVDDDVVVFCLIDLHQISLKFPKHVHNADNPLQSKVKFVKRYMEGIVAKPGRFFAFPVVQEIETWILADIQAINRYLRASISPITSPETIEKPVNTLKSLFLKHRQEDYVKTRHGPSLFKRMDAKRVYDDNCPYFVKFIDKLLDIQGLKPSNDSDLVYPVPEVDQLFNEAQAIREEFEALSQTVMSDADFDRLANAEKIVWAKIDAFYSAKD